MKTAISLYYSKAPCVGTRKNRGLGRPKWSVKGQLGRYEGIRLVGLKANDGRVVGGRMSAPVAMIQLRSQVRSHMRDYATRLPQFLWDKAVRDHIILGLIHAAAKSAFSGTDYLPRLVRALLIKTRSSFPKSEANGPSSRNAKRTNSAEIVLGDTLIPLALSNSAAVKIDLSIKLRRENSAKNSLNASESSRLENGNSSTASRASDVVLPGRKYSVAAATIILSMSCNVYWLSISLGGWSGV